MRYNPLGGTLMEKREKCVYCGKYITQRSKEHIIQKALGGLYESEEICCPECNNLLSSRIDAPFCKIFNAIVCNIPNLSKTNKKKSQPSCSGKALYDGEIYDVIIKNGKVVACAKLSHELKCDISKLDFTIIGYDFLIDSASLKNGLTKIAFNFALDKGFHQTSY